MGFFAPLNPSRITCNNEDYVINLFGPLQASYAHFVAVRILLNLTFSWSFWRRKSLNLILFIVNYHYAARRSEAFVGVADYYEEGQYFTSSGNEIIYTNWAEGEPDNEVRVQSKKPLYCMFKILLLIIFYAVRESEIFCPGNLKCYLSIFYWHSGNLSLRTLHWSLI